MTKFFLASLLSCVLFFLSCDFAPCQEIRLDDNNDTVPKFGSLHEVGVSADGKFAFAGDSERNIWVWNLENREVSRVIRRVAIGHDAPNYGFSGDGKIAIVGTKHDLPIKPEWPKPLGIETLSLWDLKNGTKLRLFKTDDEPVYSVSLSRDGSRAVTISLSKTVVPEGKDPGNLRWFEIKSIFALRLWDTESGKFLRTLSEDWRGGPVAFSSDGKLLIGPQVGPRATKQSWSIRKWTRDGADLGTKNMDAEFSQIEISCLALSPDSKTIAIGWGGVSLWDIETGKLIWHESFQRQRKIVMNGTLLGYWNVGSIAFSPDGKKIVVASKEMRNASPQGSAESGIILVNSASAKEIRGFVGTKDLVRSVEFTSDGSILVGASVDGLRLIDAQTGKYLFVLAN